MICVVRAKLYHSWDVKSDYMAAVGYLLLPSFLQQVTAALVVNNFSGDGPFLVAWIKSVSD